MRHTRSNKRSAFSLLEMVLALALAMIVLLAVYVSFNIYLTYADVGRDAVAEGALARNLMARMSSDITSQLCADDPRVVDYSAVTDAAAASQPATAQSSTTPATPATPTPMTAQPAMVQFNLGVKGESKYVMLLSYRVRKPSTPGDVADEPVSSDLRRICYWVVEDGANTLGLARMEVAQATSPDVDVDPTQLPDQKKYIIAPEVRSIKFEYFDGTGWRGDWEGFDSQETGAPPLGPPGAIRITLTFRLNKKGGPEPDGVTPPTYVHIVAIPTGNQFPAPQTATP
ncbi:MAG: prepilin-type N-terminal cleavage/methylation domain-containing protein [Planctomycetes bacterium]|nr:prepilin-type N-terminal cleavage/methylation domain-containing protein [Planctomycetota bacterium]